MEVTQHLKACIFDLDGVVVDTFGYHFQAWKRTARQLGFELTREMHDGLIGLSRMACLERILEYGNIYISDAEKLYWTDIKNNWYVELIAGMKPEEAQPGVREFLTQIREMGLQTALVSSSKNAGGVLKSTKLAPYFDIVIDGNLIKKPKPHPERYLLAADALQITPSEGLIFEDTPNGIASARSGGFRVVGIGSYPAVSDADLQFPDFTALDYAALFAWFHESFSPQTSVFRSA